MTKPNISKYRPVLTTEQISHIISLCKSEGSSLSLRVISVLAPFEYKIKNGSISSAYDSTPAKNLSDDLGFSESGTLSTEDKNTFDKMIYENWRKDPNMLFPGQIATAKQYAYTNGLMTPEELAQYENDLLGL